MTASAEYVLSADMVNVVVQSTEKLEGAASILALLEDKAQTDRISPAELAAVRSIVESCSSDLGEVWNDV